MAKPNQKSNKHEELENQLKRTMADYQNLERRIEEERKLLGQLSSALVIEKFLPVLDNLEAAQRHLKDEGLELVIKQFKEVLSSEGVEEIQAESSQFDPKLHEALEAKEGEKDNQVIKVVSRGYQINGNVLRPAKVIVERKKTEEKPQIENQIIQKGVN